MCERPFFLMARLMCLDWICNLMQKLKKWTRNIWHRKPTFLIKKNSYPSTVDTILEFAVIRVCAKYKDVACYLNRPCCDFNHVGNRGFQQTWLIVICQAKDYCVRLCIIAFHALLRAEIKNTLLEHDLFCPDKHLCHFLSVWSLQLIIWFD